MAKLCEAYAFVLLVACFSTDVLLVHAAPQENFGFGALGKAFRSIRRLSLLPTRTFLSLQPTSKSRSNPELSTSSPSGDAARYLDSSAKVFDSVVPGKFAEKLLPKFDGKKDKVCYKFVGCFSNRDRFTHPTSFPSDPEQVDTKFMLYSRSNRRSPVKLDYRPTKSIGNLAQFNQRKPLKLIVHGFLESGNVSWIQGIKDAFLDEEDCNVIIIDWSGGAQLLSYIKASGNTALVGRETSLLVQRLIGTYRNTLSKDQVHIVGFSLGGQIAGFFGRHFKNSTGQLISRITALDPAGPLFDNTSVCLSVSDAQYVDAIHTSGGKHLVVGELGIDRPVGHVDFYPNGGKKQPGCKPIDLPCDHFRATAYFLESLRNKRCRFLSKFCGGGFPALEQNKCQSSGKGGLMGYFSHMAPGRGVQLLTTNDKPQYCKA
ncbi:pancreatic lipase-related protein 2 isoform X1 [Rhipicephalus microplus]|uniref:pancreatic lipase-related protein 2 isoform X1 n=1 Tax=Rhipicephalus microplus TaxID=6941 RepID=UPI001886B2B0|nr:pancreatic lipase-related protein 2-like isoform X1 [Rhipicephalus microplus]